MPNVFFKETFRPCDDPAPSTKPTYIDEENGAKWIGVVVNEHLYEATFTAIDHCIEIPSTGNGQTKRCDGLLTYEQTAIFVELKERSAMGNQWVKDGEQQLRSTIHHFERSASNDYKIKKAYIANRNRPRFKSSQTGRMGKFLSDTGYVLRIENRIIL